jgi:choline dehydrogenase-like flavoprotein
MLPRAENRVTLDEDTTDKYGKPVPDISVDIGSHTLETADFAISIMKEILDEMGATLTSDANPETQSFGNHHKGTTRMGTDPTESVVDARLQTHDLDNLWITSSSVFPTGGAYNPTLTIAALSLKVADHIDETL